MRRKLSVAALFLAAVTCLTFAGLADAQGPVRNWLRSKFNPMEAPATMPTCDANGNCTYPAGFPLPMAGPPVTTKVGAVKAGAPFGSTLVHEFHRIKLAKQLRDKGYSISDAHALAGTVSDQMMEGVAQTVGAPAGFFQQLIGDLMTFLASPTGQQLEQALMAALLKLLGVP